MRCLLMGLLAFPQRRAAQQGSKAGLLQYSVGRISRYLKKGRYAARVGSGAPVYLAAVLEYHCPLFVAAAASTAVMRCAAHD